MKISDTAIPNEEKMFDKLEEAFLEAFVPKDLADHARQSIYSLSMERHH